MILDKLSRENKALVLGGDGRADSPGHSAKFGTYITMKLEKELVIDVQLVQVNKYHYYCYHSDCKKIVTVTL